MELHEPTPPAKGRVVLLGCLFLAGLILLGVRLYRVQIAQSTAYEQRQDRQSVRRVLLPSPRGRIFDRRGNLLADNQPNYCVAIYVEELRRPGRWSRTVDAVDDELDRLAEALRLPRACPRRRIEEHVARSLPMPLVVWEHADDAVLARLADCRKKFPGVDVFVQPERIYPQGRTAAHVLGFVGRGDLAATAQTEDYHYRLEGMKGRGGLEREYDDLLCGIPGGQLIRVDAAGYRHHEWIARQPVPGHDLNLTIDLRVQTVMESALADVRGAGVVIDPANGEIVALASSPTYDPNALSPAPSPELWRALLEDPFRPLLNRAIAGCYPPGSTFKPLVALTAQTLSGIPSTSTHTCDNVFQIGNRTIRCAHGERHGSVDMRQAIEVSCNVYFCNLASGMNYDSLFSMAQQAGFGKRTGIDLPGETTGLLPSPTWKRERLHEGWSVGDTCNIAIGQGLLLTSPLQMAVFTAAIANGGRMLRPHLVRGGHPGGEVLGQVEWPAAALNVVRGGMLDVVSGEGGTGRRARVAGVEVAAKTGTAEYESNRVKRKYGWMIAFAPVDAPRVAVAMVVEDAQTGGLTVGPRLQRVLTTIFADEIAAGAAAKEAAP